MFCEKDSKLATTVTQLWEAYLERFSDSNDEIRKICVLTISDFLLNHSELNDQIYGWFFKFKHKSLNDLLNMN